MDHQTVSPGGSDAVAAQLERILRSTQFANAERLSEFLRFTVTRTLEGRANELKEYTIGVEVFGRGESFDPRVESCVRVQAVKLRRRLHEYYAEDGSDDPVRIDYVKGSYVPNIMVRDESVGKQQTGPLPNSVAVLPFVNMSADPENEYFSDGLTEELISTLCNADGIRVVARTSVFQFKGRSVDIREIGAQLGAHMVLEGSVRKAGRRLRVTAQLSDAVTGYQRWSRTYRVELRELFSVQEEIARAISTTLTDQERTLRKRPTGSLDAYDMYLKGRYHLNKWTLESFRKSAGYFNAAIEKDQNMAVAHAGLADAYFVLACYGRAGPSQLMEQARMAALRAQELDGALAEPYASLGAVQAVYAWDWASSERAFQRAIELNPDYAQAYQWYAIACLLPLGRLQEALASVRTARELDPLSPPTNTSLGLVHFLRGEHEKAIAYFEDALELEPSFYLARWWLGVLYLQRSMPQKALAQFRSCGALSPANPTDEELFDATMFTYGDALVGHRRKARKLLETLSRRSLDEYFSPVIIASIHIALGEEDHAFPWLEKACEVRDPWLVWVGVDQRFDRVRGDARFQAILQRIGVLDSISRYSSTTG